MITLLRAGVRGTSAEGKFSGEFKFSSGLQVIHGQNYFGKSLVATATAWCLGLEPMYGFKRSDPGLFSEAARASFRAADNKLVDVLTSEAFLDVRINDQEISIRRPIVGGNPGLVEVELKGERHNLLAGNLADETGGFQAALYRWAGLPVRHVMTPRGSESAIYIENIAPLFFIEQREGWADIQALQMFRYQQLEIAEAAVEYLLGLDQRLTQRLKRQRAELRVPENLTDLVPEILADQRSRPEQGWELALTGSQPRTRGCTQWSDVTRRVC